MPLPQEVQDWTEIATQRDVDHESETLLEGTLPQMKQHLAEVDGVVASAIADKEPKDVVEFFQHMQEKMTQQVADLDSVLKQKVAALDSALEAAVEGHVQRALQVVSSVEESITNRAVDGPYVDRGAVASDASEPRVVVEVELEGENDVATGEMTADGKGVGEDVHVNAHTHFVQSSLQPSLRYMHTSTRQFTRQWMCITTVSVGY